MPSARGYVLAGGLVALVAGCGAADRSTDDLKGLLPAEVGGRTLEIRTFDGAAIVDPTSDLSRQALARIGASAADLGLAISLPELPAVSDFRIGALRITNTDWTPRLSSLIAQANVGGSVTFTQVQLGGKTVHRGVKAASPDGVKGYYHVAGDTLYFITASNEADVIEALTKLPSTGASGRSSSSPPAPASLDPDDPWAATGLLILSPLRAPTKPFCVGGAADPSQRFMFLLTDGNLTPVVMATTQIWAPFGRALPAVDTGPAPQFTYQATSWAAGASARITLESLAGHTADMGRFDLAPPLLLVEQCLSDSRWREVDRIIEIVTKGSSFTATQTEGSSTCGPPGLSFTGTFAAGPSELSGSDLIACNPEACVSAGLLDQSSPATYRGHLSDDGLVIALTWDNPVYDLDYDDDSGELISCTQGSTTVGSFTLTRTFAEPWHF